MSNVREYRNPLLIAGGAIVIAIILYVALIAPQGTKLSSLKTQETTLGAQQASLEAQLTALQHEKQQLSANCADLEKISTQIPSVSTPADLAAEQASFYDQLTTLVGASGTAIPSFAWAGASTTGSTSTATPGSTASSSTAVTPVPVSMLITGNYGQMSAFVGGLDSFPRLFVIQTFTLTYGLSSGSVTAPAAPSGTSGGSVDESSPPLWTGGAATAPTSGPYSLALTGSIYYTSTANATQACDAASAAATK